MTYFCMFCWFESSSPFDYCPRCHRDMRKLDDMTYMEKLAISLRHPEAETRHRVAHILGMRRDIRAIPALARVAEERDDISLLKEIAWALGEMRVPDALPTLRLLLRNPSFLVRKQAIIALGKIDGPEAIQSLRTACGDPIASVRETAKGILSTIQV